jgi:hypothetical protein
MTKISILLFLLITTVTVWSQTLNADYSVADINKSLHEISIDDPYASPLANYVKRMYLWSRGKYEPVYSEIIDCYVNKAENQVSPEYANNLLNSFLIKEIIYKDSVGYVIRKEPNNSMLFIGISVMENGQWKACGEDACYGGISNASEQVIRMSHKSLQELRQYYRQLTVPTDINPFVSYLKNNGVHPKQYLLSKLAGHKLTIYGEVHRRKISWDFLKELIYEPQFAELCGTIFMELPYHTRARFNNFFEMEKIDSTIIIGILGEEQIYGWQDKGMYEFIIELWKINSQLSEDRKIKIVPVDFQIPWPLIETSEDYKKFTTTQMKNRDSTMANTIEQNIKANSDVRNSIFIVGMNHARKSSPGEISRRNPVKAGTLLAERLPKEDIFSIMTHSTAGNNTRSCSRQIRYGLFDNAFEVNGDYPVAFDFKSSPFAEEYFDAIEEIRFEIDCGTFEDFYDGYIFLGPLKDEEYDYTLFEIFTDDFIEELKRRAFVANSKTGWYDIPIEELTKERIVNLLKTEQKKSGNKRFQMH